jgi:hypothetical protein
MLITALAALRPHPAVLPYTDHLPLFLRDLTGVWLLAAGIGAVGIGVAVFALRKGGKLVCAICVLTNTPSLLPGDSGPLFAMRRSR